MTKHQRQNVLKLLTSPDERNRILGRQIISEWSEKGRNSINHALQREKRIIENDSIFWEEYEDCHDCKLFGNTGQGRCPLPIAIVASDCKISIYVAEQIGIVGLTDTHVRLSTECGKKVTETPKRKPMVNKSQLNLF